MSEKYSPYVWEYDPLNNTWLQKKDMPNTIIIAASFDSIIGDPIYNPRCDLNSDGVINMQDVIILGNAWGQ